MKKDLSLNLSASPLEGIRYITEVMIKVQENKMFNLITKVMVDVQINPLADTITWSLKRNSGRGVALKVMHCYAPISLTYLEHDNQSQRHAHQLLESVLETKTPECGASLIIQMIPVS